ncbi:hypothetical protein ENH_00032350 [Eimeria necatrix]|uniref:Uncharacterized protein n=1 Tax=Eimeria necatrix TaxID=51315 RepID=U6MN37_9EIME|nr:hypothetical protein ENH_00032350 [Eimeria necatrix]CDJ63040.1 hypothetical protein ENH_00032350 [Eimeria necatrix]
MNQEKTLQIDSSPADKETLLMPDIILREEKRKQSTIADVAIVYEDYQKNSFGAARLHNEEKYQSLETFYEKRKQECLHTTWDSMKAQRGLYSAKLALTVSARAIAFGVFTWQIMARAEQEEEAALVPPHELHETLMN